LIIIDENSQVCGWFGSLEIEETGFTRVDLSTFEIANGFDTELVLIQDTVYHQLSSILKDKLGRVAAVIVFKSADSPIQYFLENVVAVLEKDLHVDLIRNKIVFIENNL
jgi:hypothetical protein